MTASRATNTSRRALRSTRRTLATEVSSSELSEEAIDASASVSPPRTLPYALYTSLILARAPLLTKTPTPLESSYYAYQSRIQRALSTPFPSEFYFKKGTLLERRFLAEERVREQAAFGEGFDGEEGAEKLEDVPSEEDEVNFLSREHEADRKGDVKDLNRQGERNLYLLVKSKEGGSWRFPVWNAGLEQPLHKVRCPRSNIHQVSHSYTDPTILAFVEHSRGSGTELRARHEHLDGSTAPNRRGQRISGVCL